jgi:hypothetical protein
MISASDLATSAISRSWVQTIRVESWWGDILLADDIPVASGNEEIDRTLAVPERVTLTIPRSDGTTSWEPTTFDHPLAPYGQRLRVSVGIALTNGQVEYVQRGWYVISSAEVSGDTVSVEALGLMSLLDEARFVTPYQPKAGQTFQSVTRNLCEPAFPVVFDSALVDRAVPTTLAWDEDRVGALHELLNAWPADSLMQPEGYLLVSPVATDSSVLTLDQGTGGTVLQWTATGSRDGAYNCAVARGQGADGSQLQGVAYDTDVSSPTRYGGSFNPLPVPYFSFSPLLTTKAQCTAAAKTALTRNKRQVGRSLAASVVPNPLLQVGDAVTVTGAGLTNQVCEINAMTLPLTPDGSSMSLRLGVV